MTEECQQERTSRIAANTLFLYLRLLITVGVALYVVRVALQALGVEDYGLYSVVSGVVALLAFLPGGMASATQRYFSHALGQHDQKRLNRTFGVNALIYLGIGLLAVVVLLTVGLWFVTHHLQVPELRHGAVVTLFVLAVGGFALSICKAPLVAIIIAHEDMRLYAATSITDALAKLAAVYLLTHLAGDKIVLYGVLLLAVAALDALIHALICFRRYEECRLRHVRWDARLAAEVLGFTGWTLFGQLTTVARSAAVTVLINQYFTPVLVAAHAIAMNIANQSTMLASQLNTSLYPPIIKAYAADRRDEMYELVTKGSRATFFLMWIVALPVFLEMPGILALWLGQPPPHTVDFARLALIEALILSISLPIATAARAPGKMAAYELILGTLQISILIISWLLLQHGHGPTVVYITAIAVNLAMFAVRLGLVHRLTGLPVAGFLWRTLPRIAAVVALSSTLAWAITWARPAGDLHLILASMVSVLIALACIYGLGMPSHERSMVREMVAMRLKWFRGVA